LIACIVPRAENKEPLIAGPCCAAIATVLKGDKGGEVSAEIVSRIGRLLKVRGANLNPGLMQAVLYLDLREKDSGKTDYSKKRRFDELSQDIHKGLKESEAEVDHEKRNRLNNDMLQVVVIMYFRVLKQSVNSPLLPYALEGLSKTAHLLNVGVVVDLLQLLKNLFPEEHSSELSLVSSLRCAHTALKLLDTYGDELKYV
jgi:nucleolar complex protein 3